MQPLAEQLKAPQRAQEQLVSNLRREKDYLGEQYSNEKGNRMRLQEELQDISFRMGQQEKEIHELRMANERLLEQERYSFRQIEDLKARNLSLETDVDNQIRQIRAQEDAIVQASNLKDKTDMMVRDYEKTRADLRHACDRNDDLTRENEHLRHSNGELEERVMVLSRDNEAMRQHFGDK
jgi:chromosome segregation ATPase